LAKKGPLGKIWQAAHWGDKKLGRPAVFSTYIEAAVDHIVDPAIPLALRVSSHLLWGVVRIYSRQVQYLLDDCQQAMTKVSFVNHPAHGKGGGPNSTTKIDLNISNKQQNNLNVSNFAEHVPTDGPVVDFAIPFIDEDTDEADWVPAELPDEDTSLHIPQHHHHHHQKETTADEYEMNNDEQWGGVEFDPDDENATDSTGSIMEKPRAAKQSEVCCENFLFICMARRFTHHLVK
jgi:cohesin complex subunit SCC1